MSPVDELRAAAAKLRPSSPAAAVHVTPAVMEALAKLLDDSATVHLPDTECGYCDSARNPLRLPCPALAVARSINGEQR
ncbi:hypothetical protein [Streptomyces sp. NPDC001781]